eukprot:3438844-Rhodomonas_salina.1
MTKQRRCCTAGLLICVVMLMAMMCSAEQSSVEADASQTGHWNAEGSVRFHDIPEEHALDSSLPRSFSPFRPCPQPTPQAVSSVLVNA